MLLYTYIIYFQTTSVEPLTCLL